MDVHSTAFLTQRNTFSHLFFKICNVCLFILQNGRFFYFFNDYEEEGTAGYCEYIDCRPLKWQEKKNEAKNTEQQLETAPIALKK